MFPNCAALQVATLACTLLPGVASALQLSPNGAARIDGHAAGTFATLNDPAGFAGGLAWGPDGAAYTLDGARVLYRWNARTGQPVSRTVLAPPLTLPDANANFGPRLRLDGYRADGGTLSGPFIRVQGYARNRGYQTAYTLRPGGRAVLGDVCPRSTVRPAGCFGGYRASVLTRQGGRATLRLEGGGQSPRTLTLPTGTVLDLVPSPDGARVAALRSVDGGRFTPGAPLFLDVATRDGHVVSRQVMDSVGVQSGGEPQVRWVDATRILTATPQNTSVAESSSGHRVSLWGLSGQSPHWTVGAGELRGAVPSPDKTLFLTVRGGSVPELHRVSDGTFVRSLGAAVTASVPLTGGSALLALDTGNGQGELRTLRPGGQGQRLHSERLGGQELEGVTGLAVSPDGRFLAAARSGSVAVLNRAGHTLHTLALPGDISRVELAFTGSTTLFARLEDGGGSGGWSSLIWDAPSGQVINRAANTRPVGTLRLQAGVRRLPGGAFQSRLGAFGPDGTALWQEAWRGDYRPSFLSSPDGRALVRGVSQPIKERTEQADLYLYRLDPRTGQASPGLTLRTGDREEAYRGLSLLDYAADRRFVLLGEGSGDGCGGAFYGLRLADLKARQEVKLPAALTSGLTRFFGCGQPLSRPTAVFTPDRGGGKVLVSDGNALNWWRWGSAFMGPRHR